MNVFGFLRRMFDRPRAGRERVLLARHKRVLRRGQRALPGDSVLADLMRQADEAARGAR